MLGGSAACGPAATAVGALAAARFAQNKRARSESVASIGGVVLRVMVSSACDAYGGVTSSLEYPAVCVPAETTSLAEVLAFGDLLDDLGSDKSSWKLSSGRVCCSVGRPVSVAISVGCPVACGAAGSAALADLVVLDEFFDSLGARRLILQLSSVRVCCFVDAHVASVGVMSSVGCRVACGAAETAVSADLVVLDEFSCTPGAGRFIL
jgi:hypothetical protein